MRVLKRSLDDPGQPELDWARCQRRPVSLNGHSPVLALFDLFCGCGGFSLGLHKAGLKTLAAIDVDPKAIDVYRANLAEHVPHTLFEDLTKFAPADWAERESTLRVAFGPC